MKVDKPSTKSYCKVSKQDFKGKKKNSLYN